MKKLSIIYIIFLCIIYAFKMEFFSSDNRIYLLLDRNSKNIVFNEDSAISNCISFENKFYTLKTNINDYAYNVTFSHLELVHFDRKDEKLKKPVSFLDSISYYDEKYIMCAKDIDQNELRPEFLRNNKIFVLDMGTLKNDTIIMYEVTVDFSEFKQ